MIKLASSNENVQRFLNHVQSNLRRHKFKLILSLDDIKIGENVVAGYFDEVDREIVISTKCPEYLDVLVHEFCHFLQYIERDETYFDLQRNERNMLEELWEYLNENKKFKSAKRKNLVFRSVIAMELDCERRSVEMIKKYDLPIDLEEYIFVAHCYVHYYNYAKKYRTWFKDDVGVKGILEIKNMKNVSLDGKFNKLPEGYEEIFKKYSKTP